MIRKRDLKLSSEDVKMHLIRLSAAVSLYDKAYGVDTTDSVPAIRSHIAALEAELARLTPSGQVAEDEHLCKTVLNVANAGPSGPISDDCYAALSRLAAQAQGYEAMKADLESWRAGVFIPAEQQQAMDSLKAERDEVVRWLGDVTEALLGERPVGAMPGTTVDAARALRAENERALRLASDACAKSERVEAERDAAVADNAARDLKWQSVKDEIDARPNNQPPLEWWKSLYDLLDDEATSPGVALLAEHTKALEIVELVRQYRHRDEPDELTTLRRLLEERARIAHMVNPEAHAKALVRARNEGLEEVWSMATVAVGDDLKAYLQGPAPHDQIINTALRAIQRCLVQLRREEPET